MPMHAIIIKNSQIGHIALYGAPGVRSRKSRKLFGPEKAMLGAKCLPRKIRFLVIMKVIH